MEPEIAKKILEKNKEDYEELAKEFSRTRAYPWPEIKPLIKYVKENNRILDLGCGNGRLFSLFKDKKVEYIGLDSCQELIEIARKKLQVKFIVGDALNLPFQNNEFDVVFGVALLHHIPSEQFRQKVLKECRRVLKPGGFLIVTCWNLWQPRLMLKYRIWPMIFGWRSRNLDWKDIFIPWKLPNRSLLRYYHAFTLRELKRLVWRAGFEINSWQKGHNLAIIAKKR